MNHKTSREVIYFWNCMHWYVEKEYPDYFQYFTTNDRKRLDELWNMMYSYYLGGNGAEDTAGYIVDYLKLATNKTDQT
jgi:hypothetical protein